MIRIIWYLPEPDRFRLDRKRTADLESEMPNVSNERIGNLLIVTQQEKKEKLHQKDEKKEEK